MQKLDMQSKDRVQDNIQKIRTLFPSAVKEVKRGGKVSLAVDFDVLRQEMSSSLIEGNEERYQFTWPDKRKAILLANTPINATLRPAVKESENFDTTQNLYIEGDNLEVLKLLQETYLGRVKVIYIDPPYNTGKDFVYKDNFTQDAEQYKAGSGQYDEEGNRLVQNVESNGRFHTDWLNMIYPRLKIARDLLSDDGVIFISCDDNEQANLIKICDEIFGRDNLVATLIWKKKAGGANDSDDIAVEHEYVICYSKAENSIGKIPLGDERIKEYKYSDDKEETHGKYMIKNLNDKSLQDSKGLHYDITCPDGTVLLGSENQWKCNQQTFYDRLHDDRIVFIKKSNGEWTCNYKIYLNEEKGKLRYDEKGNIIKKGRNLSSIIDNVMNRNGNDEIKELFNSYVFSYPKPSLLIKQLLQCGTKKDSIVLDFFSGTATTAHAVMQLNAEDGGKRRFIMVQLPESLDEALKTAGKANKTLEAAISFLDSIGKPHTICEIGKERIRRAGKKIKERLREAGPSDRKNKKAINNGAIMAADAFWENDPDYVKEANKMADNLDTGFRVLKLDSSNMKDVYYSADEYKQVSLLDYADNIKEDRTSLDLLFQVMLQLGHSLSAKIEEKMIANKQVFVVDDDDIIACFAADVDEEVITEIAKMHPLYAVFRDSSMQSDSARVNFEQIFAVYSPATDRRVI